MMANQILKNKKAKMTMGIIILVIATLILVITALYFINTVAKDLATGTSPDYKAMDIFYADEYIFDFYLYSIAKTVIGENPGISAYEFLPKFIEQYSLKMPLEYMNEIYLGQLRNNPHEIKIESNKLTFILKNFDMTKDVSAADLKIKSIKHTRNIKIEVPLGS